MRPLVRPVLFAAAAGLAAAGCTGASSGPAGGPTAASTAADKPGTAPDHAPAAAGAVGLTDVTYAGLDAAVQKNKGKVVLIDVWSTHCAPCKKKFPHMVALHDRHAKDGLVLMTLSVDDKDDRANALEYLKQQKATGTNFFLQDTDENEKKWGDKYPAQQIPVVMAVNRKGERVLTDMGKLSEGEIDKLVEKLLAEK